MRIKKIVEQHRRDFTAIYICEHCGSTRKMSGGYDDDNFHRNVIPNFKCKKCGKKASKEYLPLETKYPEGFVV